MMSSSSGQDTPDAKRALAAARMGCETLIVTINPDTIAKMSCNPAIGGLAKGHLVKEIDALGGEMAKTIDKTGIQFRRLNTKKGPRCPIKPRPSRQKGVSGRNEARS